jgi:uncharacterized protein (DUF427 family)
MYNFPLFSLLPSPRWVRAFVSGQVIANSRSMVLFFQRPYPNYLFPKKDVDMRVLRKSTHTEYLDGRGTTEFWNLETAAATIDNAAFSYPDCGAGDYIGFKWDAIDRWLEEEEEIFVHARNPYHRVDAVPSSREIAVALDGIELAHSCAPVLLFESGLPTRHYLPQADVNMTMLEKTATITQCPYKGIAHTYGVRVNGVFYPDYAWAYAHPIAECAAVKDMICFYDEVVDTCEDGVAQPRPVTHFK